MQIQKLEEELGILIFDRKTKPISLTPVGEKIVSQARKIVNEAKRMHDVVDQEKGFIGGEFRLGIIPTIMPTLLPLFLKTFAKKHPKVQLIIEEHTTQVLIKKLRENNLDAAIAATPLEQDKIIERALYYEPFVGYVPKNHRLTSNKKLNRKDLELEDILLLEDGHCFRDGVINLCKSSKARLDDTFHIESGSFETLVKLANESMGMTLLPYLHTLDLAERFKPNLRFFEEPSPAREVSLIYSSSELKMQIINALYDVIASIIRGLIQFEDVNIISPTK